MPACMISGSNLWSASPTLTVWVCDTTELTGFGVLDIVNDGSALTAQSCRVELSKSANDHDWDHRAFPLFVGLAIVSWRNVALGVQIGLSRFYRLPWYDIRRNIAFGSGNEVEREMVIVRKPKFNTVMA
jgi:hypothetical protein